MSVIDLAPQAPAPRGTTPVEHAPTSRSLHSLLLLGLVAVGVALRILWIVRNGSSFDESFTAIIGRHSLGGLFDALRAGDSHPPLDYLLRAPLARAGVGTVVLRLPSLVFSVSALALFAWWMRTRGGAGLVALAVMAVSPFQIMYGGEARMYALLELLGVAAALLAETWLRNPRRWHAAAIGGLVLVGVFDHVSGFLLAGGLLAVAGLRNDRGAWRWRVGIAVPVVVWAVVWGTSFLAQASTTHASWIDRTTLRSFTDAISRQVTNQSGVVLLVLAIVGVGIVMSVRTDRALGRVMLCCGVLPFVAAAVIGLFAPFFLDRTVTVAAWAPCLAIGFAVDAAWRRSRPVGVAVALLVAALVVPATLVFLDRHWEYDASVDHLVAVTRPGDIVATVPDWYGPLADWRVGVQEFGGATRVHVPHLAQSDAIRLGPDAATGRVWVLSFAGDHRTFPGSARCASDWTDGVTVVSCLVATPSPT
jgi:uncharacterized membrane protein